MSRFENYNHYQVSGWMVKELHLKGTQLQIYAIIYGFCQDEESEFFGSINYLCAWTSSAKNTVMKALKELVDGKYIFKRTEVKNGVTFNYYRVNFELIDNCTRGSKIAPGGSKIAPGGGSKIAPGGGSKIAPGGGSKIAPNNNIIDNNILDNNKDIYNTVMEYFNQVTGKNLSVTSDIKKMINGRMREEKATLEDFKHVIDVKYEEWFGTDYEKYVRPSTLFSKKHFSEYRSQKMRNPLPQHPESQQDIEPAGRFDNMTQEDKTRLANKGIINLETEDIEYLLANELNELDTLRKYGL